MESNPSLESSKVPSNPRLQAIEEVRSTLQARGAWMHPSIEYCSTNDGRGVCMRVSPTSVPIPAHTIIAFIPKKFSCKRDKIELAIAIAKCLFSKSDAHIDGADNIKRYLSMCPKYLQDLPVQYAGSDEIVDQWAQYDKEFSMLTKAIYENERNAFETYLKAHPDVGINFSEYLEAAILYNTRAWSDFGLVPLIDMAQHQNRPNSMVFSALQNGIPNGSTILNSFIEQHPDLEIGVQDPMLITDAVLKPGDDIVISYGNKTMVNMLANYGFADLVKPQVIMNVGGANATDAAKKFIQDRKLMKDFVLLDEPAGFHPGFFYINRIASDKNFDPSKDYTKVFDMNLERVVFADAFSCLSKYKAILDEKIQKLSAIVTPGKVFEKPHEQFYAPLLEIAKTELLIINKNLEYLRGVWSSYMSGKS